MQGTHEPRQLARLARLLGLPVHAGEGDERDRDADQQITHVSAHAVASRVAGRSLIGRWTIAAAIPRAIDSHHIRS